MRSQEKKMQSTGSQEKKMGVIPQQAEKHVNSRRKITRMKHVKASPLSPSYHLLHLLPITACISSSLATLTISSLNTHTPIIIAKQRKKNEP